MSKAAASELIGIEPVPNSTSEVRKRNQRTRGRRKGIALRLVTDGNLPKFTDVVESQIGKASRERRQPKPHKRYRRQLLHDPITGTVEAYDTLACGCRIGDKRAKHFARAVRDEIKDFLLGDPYCWKAAMVSSVDDPADAELIRELLDDELPLGDFTGTVRVGTLEFVFMLGQRIAPTGKTEPQPDPELIELMGESHEGSVTIEALGDGVHPTWPGGEFIPEVPAHVRRRELSRPAQEGFDPDGDTYYMLDDEPGVTALQYAG